VVLAAVGEKRVGLAARVSDPAAYRRDGIEQRHELGGVVAVAAGEDDRERSAVAVSDQKDDLPRVATGPAVTGSVRTPTR